MPPIILRIILIVFGILLFVCAMLSYAGKKLKEVLFTGVVSVCTVFYPCRHYSGTQLLYRDFRCFFRSCTDDFIRLSGPVFV